MRSTFARSSRFKPRLTLNKMAATISKRKKSITKANARKGVYKDDISDYMKDTVVLTTFNNCLVCMRYANKSYFGRAACDMLEAQLKYANGMGASSSQMNVKMEIAKLTGLSALYENRLPTPDPQVRTSYGLMPYNRQGVFITNSDEYWENLYCFILENAVLLSDDQIDTFYNNPRLELPNSEITIIDDKNQEIKAVKYVKYELSVLIDTIKEKRDAFARDLTMISRNPEPLDYEWIKHFSSEYFRDIPWYPEYRDNLGSWTQLNPFPKVFTLDSTRWRSSDREKIEKLQMTGQLNVLLKKDDIDPNGNE